MPENIAVIKKIFLGVIAVLFVVLVGFSVWKMRGGEKAADVPPVGEVPPVASVEGCVVSEQTSKVSGDSMRGILEDGQEVKVLKDYYRCHPGSERIGDIVVFNYGAPGNTMVKSIKAKPGDTFALVSAGQEAWNIVVNRETLKNSKGELYVIGKGSYDLLSLYIRDYKGMIPGDAYLVLGNVAEGSFDSTRFGLLGAEGILGKVIMK